MENRKEMVKEISAFTLKKAKYLGAPSFAYQIGNAKVLKDGTLAFDEDVNPGEASNLIYHLLDKGFRVGPHKTEEEAEEKEEPQQIALTIKLPKATFTPEAIENLNKLLDAKGELIKSALSLEKLPEVVDEGDKVSFPWFTVSPSDSDMVEAYGKLVCALCDMARNQKRVTAKEQHPANQRYAFRCFLLRLGFIGAEYKKTRSSLLKNLIGSSSWKEGDKHGNA